MRVVKVYFENGDHLTTEINGTNKQIEEYYLGKFFNLGRVKDNMQKCIKIEFIK